jgi:nucleotide-binding universal stress UspA family protein
MGALSQNLYTMIVTMAVLTTMAMPPMLRAALSGIPMSKEEKIRVERESLDEKGFLFKLERLLIAVDASPLGHMAARMAGLLAGAHGMPVTVLKLESDLRTEKPPRKKEAGDTGESDKSGKHRERAPGKQDAQQKVLEGALSVEQSATEMAADPVAREIKSGAKAGADKVKRDEAEPAPEKVHIISKIPSDRPAEVVKDEARKGYDMLFVGMENSIGEAGDFSPELVEIAAGFNGPLALLASADGEAPPKLNARTKILLPVNGTPSSRNAAEISFAMARAIGARITLLFVSRSDGHSRTLRGEEGMLKDLSDLAARYSVSVDTRISKRGAAPEAILREGKSGYDLVVMGVSPRPGDELFFGNTASTVLKDASVPVLLIAS